MITDQYITYDIEPLSIKDTVAEAIRRMNQFHVDVLPVVDNMHLVNYADFELLEELDENSLLSEIELFATVLPFVKLNQHLLDALTHLKSLDVSLMAVLDENGEYQGVLRTRDVVKAFSESLSIRNSGSIIVIKMKAIDYSFSNLSRVIEYSDAKILGLFVFESKTSDDLEIHIKLNITHLKHVLATLERYDYKVIQYFNREDASDDLDERYQNLMTYIDI